MTRAVSIVVPTRNRASVLALTLPHMLDQRLPGLRYEVIVADDASTDNTREVVEDIDDERLIYLRVHRSGAGGAAASRNRAVETARGDVIVFLDDDAFVGPNFLARHLRAHGGFGNRLVAGGIVEIRQPPRQHELRESEATRHYHRHPMPGGNSSVRRVHLISVGGFDEEFDAYGWQDQELAERLLRMGLVRKFASGAPILHYKPAATVLDPRHELERELERGRMGARFYARHPRILVGITTKQWRPLHVIDALIAGVLGLRADSERILAGERVMDEFRGVRAALLRAHVEIGAGRAELERIARSVGKRPSAVPGLNQPGEGARRSAKSASEANVG
jgi:glycosyltransferase involved in cell wall biosynthesis